MDVLITSDAEKLPVEILQLQDSNRPLPANVQFFEQQFTFATLIKQFLWGILLMPVGAIIFVLCLVLMFTPDRNATVTSSSSTGFMTGVVIGLVLMIGGYLFLKSLWPKYQLMQQQHRGRATRYGIFLVGDLLVCHSWEDTTIIPKPFFKGVKAQAVQYELKGEAKSFNLPDALIGTDVQRLEVAIGAWAA